MIDEVQYAPELFRYIKFLLDKSEEKGQICLAGSQTYALMKNVTQSLAGRIGILEMQGFSTREKLGIDFFDAFVPKDKYLDARGKFLVPCGDIWTLIHRGTMPALNDASANWNFFYGSYIKSYIERDVRNLMSIKDENLFYKFIVALASRTGCLFNAADIANTIGVSLKTVQSWTSGLEASGLIFFLRPYESNLLKRAVKTPKIFFHDTGLVCYLVGWDNPKVLQNGAMSGEIFETFVIAEIVKSWCNCGLDLRNLFFYRDTNKKEIDLIVREGANLFPVEIKHSANPTTSMAKHFPSLDALSGIQNGTILCRCERPLWISENVRTVPIDFL